MSPGMLDAWASIDRSLLWFAVAASALVFLASLLVVPAMVVRIPSDYFAHRRRPPGRWAHAHPIARWSLRIAKNLLGVLLMLAGVAMLVLPGQGLLTIAMGFLLIDFPGKYGLERWLVRRRAVRRSINWLRRRHGRAPLVLEPQGNQPGTPGTPPGSTATP